MLICNIFQRFPLCCLPLNRLRLSCRLHEKMLSMLLVKQPIFEQEFNLSGGLLRSASHIIRSDASRHQEPGPLIVGIFKPTHIGHVPIVARQATLDRFPCGGIDPFLHCGKWCGAFRLDITEHLDLGCPASTQIPVQDFSDLNVLNRYNIWMYNCLWFYHITITIL